MLQDVADDWAPTAVVFSEPESHRTLQLKGTDAREVALSDPATRRAPSITSTASLRGWNRSAIRVDVLRTLLACSTPDLTALAFLAPSSGNGFQTPGPEAGTAAAERIMKIALDAIRNCLDGAIPGHDRHAARPTARPTSPTSRRCEYVDAAARRAVVAVLQQDAPATCSANPVVVPAASSTRAPSRAMYRLVRALPAHRDRRPAVRAHEGQARRHRVAHRHERGLQAAGRRRLPRSTSHRAPAGRRRCRRRRGAATCSPRCARCAQRSAPLRRPRQALLEHTLDARGARLRHPSTRCC
ncbi:MAG: hypothetical protein MZW92_44025 [Comamonadaceae bacterium]|nr:hypothetical protein [Comamonadaceae bacterium]